MLGIITRFRKISICIFQTRVLVAMSELFFQPDIAVVVMFIAFNRTLGAIRIIF